VRAFDRVLATCLLGYWHLPNPEIKMAIEAEDLNELHGASGDSGGGNAAVAVEECWCIQLVRWSRKKMRRS